MSISDSMEILQHPDWLAYDWLIHGFSTRAGGYSTAYDPTGELNLGFTPADERKTVQKNRQLLMNALLGQQPARPTPAALATISQVHSADIQIITGAAPKSMETGDGLLTAEPGVLLGILTADCVPVLVADIRLRVVGAFHAGWRGTVQRIVEKGIARMIDGFGSRPADLRALIGPSIGKCCYAVGAEVQERFREEFGYATELMDHPPGEANEVVRLDLREANRRQLLDTGVSSGSIELVGGCTSCEPKRYFSHRQSGGATGRMMSVAGIRGVQR